MPRLPDARWIVFTLLSTASCSRVPSVIDPQQPLPSDRADSPAHVVICPSGSTYDPSRNLCVGVTPTPSASSGSTLSSDAPPSR